MIPSLIAVLVGIGAGILVATPAAMLVTIRARRYQNH